MAGVVDKTLDLMIKKAGAQFGKLTDREEEIASFAAGFAYAIALRLGDLETIGGSD